MKIMPILRKIKLSSIISEKRKSVLIPTHMHRASLALATCDRSRIQSYILYRKMSHIGFNLYTHDRYYIQQKFLSRKAASFHIDNTHRVRVCPVSLSLPYSLSFRLCAVYISIYYPIYTIYNAGARVAAAWNAELD